jgi:NodT family efflux transporter outer membrane factor (OMF) lipoprotein
MSASSRRLAVRPLASLVAIVAIAATSACTEVGRDFEPPKSDAVPAEWRESGATAPATTLDRAAPVDLAVLAAWWRQLHDPTLDSLVERATAGDLGLREAFARVAEARALRGAAAADRFPTLDATASFQRSALSENTPFGAFVPETNNWAAGFDATWELDLWGRVRREVEASDADLAARVEDVRDLRLSVAAETALNYVELRALQRRVAVAKRNVELQEETLAVVRGRFESGMVGERDLAQAATVVESTRARVPAFEAGLRAAENRLAVLMGLAPGALASELAEDRPIPVPPLAIAVGLPADLLRRRADVRRAERQLAAETARVGVAEGDLYPRLALNGNLGLAAEDVSDLLDARSRTFGFGPSLRWNLFDAGRLRDRVNAQDARVEQARLRWERTVLAALEESENAMTAFVREQLRRASLEKAAAQARRAVELAQTQYRSGLSDFQAVLDSERAVAGLEDDLAQSDAAVTTDVVRLYKALGGGWPETEARAERPDR